LGFSWTGEIVAVEGDHEGFLRTDLDIECPSYEPTLVIHSATYGHPGAGPHGARTYDVKELVQVLGSPGTEATG
jgi:hypothetical protein